MRTLCLALLLVAAAAHADEKRLQPGQWEATVKMQIEGMPHELPPVTQSRCIKPEEVKSPRDLVKTMQGQQTGNCQNQEVQLAGNKLTWKLVCTGRHAGGGTAEINFGATEYSGLMTLELTDAHGARHKMKGTMTGRRLGDCKEP